MECIWSVLSFDFFNNGMYFICFIFWFYSILKCIWSVLSFDSFQYSIDMLCKRSSKPLQYSFNISNINFFSLLFWYTLRTFNLYPPKHNFQESRQMCESRKYSCDKKCKTVNFFPFARKSAKKRLKNAKSHFFLDCSVQPLLIRLVCGITLQSTIEEKGVFLWKR